MINITALLMSNALYVALSIVCLVLILLASLFVIVVVMMQQSNSEGISAISGQSETFYGKNKSKTIESKLKKITVVSLIVIGVLCVLYFVIGLLK
ncbi:MAG: preprotein translocase subunit SecG [Clostridia bacterium]|nr:preprotein translocase subunit SecG [Clostridia bacterium]